MDQFDLTNKAITDIMTELIRARSLFPSNEDILTALNEETGEVNKAILENKHQPEKNVTSGDIYKECIQTAVMAIRLATEGDPNFNFDPENGCDDYQKQKQLEQ